MRDQQERRGSLVSCISIEERLPASHPLRRIRRLADQSPDLVFTLIGPTDGPGPFPLFGAAAAFGWSRCMRKRIATVSSATTYRL
jgi:hypothetical protein